MDLKEFEIASQAEGLQILHSALPQPTAKNIGKVLAEIERQMREAADNLNFELAADLRDRLFELRQMKLK